MLFNRKNEQRLALLPKVEIKSFSEKAIIYRSMNRKYVDKDFAMADQKKILPDGTYGYVRSKEERENIRIKAKNKWYTIIKESNEL
jgi:hypothetical protein